MGSGRGQRRRARNSGWWANTPGWEEERWQNFLNEHSLAGVTIGTYYEISQSSNEAEEEKAMETVALELLQDFVLTQSITLPVDGKADEFKVILNINSEPRVMEVQLEWRGKIENVFNFPEEFLSPENTFGSDDARFGFHHLGVAAARLLTLQGF